MLGLGDIIVPGIIISLAFNYDVDCCILGKNKPKNHKQFKLPLYYTCLFFYFLALCLTYFAVKIFGKAQPALVFIVPALSLALLLDKCFANRIGIWEYSSSIMTIKHNSSQFI